MSKTKYDVYYPSNGIPRPEPHFCREFDMDEEGNFVGCYGTNMNHGMTFEEAKQEVIEWLERELEAVKQMQEEEHALDEMVRMSQLNGEYDDQDPGRQWWEDNVS